MFTSKIIKQTFTLFLPILAVQFDMPQHISELWSEFRSSSSPVKQNELHQVSINFNSKDHFDKNKSMQTSQT